MDAVDGKIRALGGEGGSVGAIGNGRPRNAKNLVEAITDVLTSSGKPLGVRDILEGVLRSGYRSSAVNFRAVINVTLIKERKRFKQVARGTYGLAKRASS